MNKRGGEGVKWENFEGGFYEGGGLENDDEGIELAISHEYRPNDRPEGRMKMFCNHQTLSSRLKLSTWMWAALNLPTWDQIVEI